MNFVKNAQSLLLLIFVTTADNTMQGAHNPQNYFLPGNKNVQEHSEEFFASFADTKDSRNKFGAKEHPKRGPKKDRPDRGTNRKKNKGY